MIPRASQTDVDDLGWSRCDMGAPNLGELMRSWVRHDFLVYCRASLDIARFPCILTSVPCIFKGPVWSGWS